MPNPTTSKRSQITAVQTKSAPKKAERIPPLPKTLDPAYKTEWQGIIRHLMAQDAWLPQKASMVEVYLVNLQAMRQAQDRMTADGGVITADGKMHPSSQVIARHSGFLTKLGPQLGLGRENLIAAPATKPTAAKSTWSA